MSDIKVYVPKTYQRSPFEAGPGSAAEGGRIPRPHDCERCGRHMEWDDQECGCSARDPWLNR